MYASSNFEGVAAEEIELVIGVFFFSYLVMVHMWLLRYVLCLINKNGCVHHNDAEAGGFNLLLKKRHLVTHRGHLIMCRDPSKFKCAPWTATVVEGVVVGGATS